MNIEQAKVKLNSVNNCTGTKHPKVLISELCVIIKFLLEEIDRINIPTVSLFPQRPPEDIEVNPPDLRKKQGFPEIICNQLPLPNTSRPLISDHPLAL